MKKNTLQTLLKHKLQWLVLLAALLGVSQGVWGTRYPAGKRFYVQYSEKCDNLTIHLWIPDGAQTKWPGKSLTYIGKIGSYYYYYLPEGEYNNEFEKYIISKSGESKTGDLSVTSSTNNLFTTSNNNSNFEPSGSEECFTGKEIIVHLNDPGSSCNSCGWNGNAFLYAYNGSTKLLGNWQGTELSKVNSQYSYTFENSSNYNNITVIFSSQHDWGGNKAKTADITLNKGYEYTFSLSNSCTSVDKDSKNINQKISYTQNSSTALPTTRAPFVALDNSNNSSASGSSVTLYGYIAQRGCQDLTSYGFQYNTTKSGTGAVTATTSGDHAIGSYNKTFTVSTSGTYYYRAVATYASGTVYSDWSDDTFEIVACTLPTELNFTVSGNTPTYDGTAKTATVASSNISTYEPASITAGYGSSSSSTTLNKTNAGTYDVYITAAGADAKGTYCEVTSPITKSVGTLTIKKVEPTDSNKEILFDITVPSSSAYTGTAKTATVSWKTAYQNCGAITIKYYNGSTLLDGAPVNVGSYTVKISVEDGTNNNASASDISVGTLTITKIDQSTAVTILNSGTHCIPSSGSYVDISASGGDTSEALTYSVVGTPSSGISLSDGTISATNAGSITVTATRPGGANYNDKTSSNYTFTFVVTPTSVSVTPASPVTHTLPSSVTTPSVTQSATATHTGDRTAWTLSPNYTVNTISDASATNPTLTFKREGVYTATVGVGCKNTTDVSSNSATITVEPPLTIYLSGTLVSSAQDAFGDNNFPMTRTAGSYVYTRRFNAVAGSSAATDDRRFSLRESNSSGQADYLIPKYAKVTYTNIATTGSNNDMYTTDITYSAGNTLEVRAEYKGYNSSENKPEWDISIGLVCDAPDSKTISISSESICRGSDVSVVVNSSQSGYIYTVYDAGNTQVGTTTGDGTNKSISVTSPTESTTYTVKAKQAASCTPTEMANTVSVTVNDIPTFSPTSGITQYLPVTVTSTATTPAWSFTKVSGSATGAWLSNTDESVTIFKAPTGTYTVSDGTCATGSITVSDDTETCD